MHLPKPAISPRDETSGQPSPSRAIGQDGFAALPRRKILVVDDTRASCYILGKLLEKMGHEARLASDATTALQYAIAEKPDLIFSDISMPDMDGYQFARCVRQNPELDDTLLVALTGYGQESDKQHALEAGFDYHLVKPVGYEVLQALLANPSPRRQFA